ncbi:MAG: hypothetical protein STSR0001_10300 [Methanothrix sp.]
MACRFWKDRPDGFHGYCQHPEAQQGDPCILNTEDECLLREEPGEELEAVHTCAVCGHTMGSGEYAEKGCIFCGADSEEEQ